MAFDITCPGIVHCGAGEFSRAADETARMGSRAVVVTGSHLYGSDLISILMEDLADRGVRSTAAPAIAQEPSVEMVDDLAAFLRAHGAQVVVAIGGGSVMDTAKAAAVMACNEGVTEDYQLKRREIVNPPLAQVFAPTTAGTGSEATRVSVLTNNAVGVKRSISHPLMTPGAVILDPGLTASCSRYLTTVTAMDAYSHAIESAVSRSANAYTRNMGLAAVEQMSVGLPRCQANPDDLDARLACLLGSCFAGLAMQAGLGASHSLAPAVCIVGGMRHSEAVGALLPHVIRLNERQSPGLYDEVRRVMRVDDPAARIEELSAKGGFSNSLGAFEMKASDWPQVCEAMNRYGSHRQTNPSEVTDEFARDLYLAAVES